MKLKEKNIPFLFCSFFMASFARFHSIVAYETEKFSVLLTAWKILMPMLSPPHIYTTAAPSSPHVRCPSCSRANADWKYRNIFQLYHVYGCFFGCTNRCCIKLSPSNRWHSRDASMGKCTHPAQLSFRFSLVFRLDFSGYLRFLYTPIHSVRRWQRRDDEADAVLIPLLSQSRIRFSCCRRLSGKCAKCDLSIWSSLYLHTFIQVFLFVRFFVPSSLARCVDTTSSPVFLSVILSLSFFFPSLPYFFSLTASRSRQYSCNGYHGSYEWDDLGKRLHEKRYY